MVASLGELWNLIYYTNIILLMLVFKNTVWRNTLQKQPPQAFLKILQYSLENTLLFFTQMIIWCVSNNILEEFVL